MIAPEMLLAALERCAPRQRSCRLTIPQHPLCRGATLGTKRWISTAQPGIWGSHVREEFLGTAASCFAFNALRSCENDKLMTLQRQKLRNQQWINFHPSLHRRQTGAVATARRVMSSRTGRTEERILSGRARRENDQQAQRQPPARGAGCRPSAPRCSPADRSQPASPCPSSASVFSQVDKYHCSMPKTNWFLHRYSKQRNWPISADRRCALPRGFLHRREACEAALRPEVTLTLPATTVQAAHQPGAAHFGSVSPYRMRRPWQ